MVKEKEPRFNNLRIPNPTKPSLNPTFLNFTIILLFKKQKQPEEKPVRVLPPIVPSASSAPVNPNIKIIWRRRSFLPSSLRNPAWWFFGSSTWMEEERESESRWRTRGAVRAIWSKGYLTTTMWRNVRTVSLFSCNNNKTSKNWEKITLRSKGLKVRRGNGMV